MTQQPSPSQQGPSGQRSGVERAGQEAGGVASSSSRHRTRPPALWREWNLMLRVPGEVTGLPGAGREDWPHWADTPGKRREEWLSAGLGAHSHIGAVDILFIHQTFLVSV